jgi:peptide chain release factor 2
MKSIFQLVESCKDKVKVLEEIIPLTQHQKRLNDIDEIIAHSNLWNNPKEAAALMKERQKLSDLLDKMNYFKSKSDFYKEFYNVMPSEMDALGPELSLMESILDSFELEQMLQDPVDDTPAIISINAGAGGLEAANWVTMLLRMYLRYAESYKFNTEILSEKPSEEHSSICTDSVSIRVEGPNAYGFFKGESGVHRLIRNSPFNSGDARHTSFAGVSVTPDIEDKIDIQVHEKDLEITAQTGGGPGGQNVNKVASAIRLKHIPSGINILVRTERDQLANRKTAIKMLKAKLYDIELKKKNSEKEKQLSQQSDVAFGHQVRSYTLTPYQLVKDERTDYQNRDADNVLDGNLHEFIIAYLRFRDKIT